MKRDHFENSIKEHLLHYEMPVDGHEIWIGVEEKLYGKKKKKAWWMWWSGAVVLLFLIFGWYFIPSKSIPFADKKPTTAVVNPGQTTSQVHVTPNADIGTNTSSGNTASNNPVNDHSAADATTKVSSFKDIRQSNPNTQISNIKSSTGSNQTNQKINKIHNKTTTRKPLTKSGDQNKLKKEKTDLIPSNKGFAHLSKASKVFPVLPGLPSISIQPILVENMKKILISMILFQMDSPNEKAKEENLVKTKTSQSNGGFAVSSHLGYGIVDRRLGLKQTNHPGDLSYLALREGSEAPLEALQGGVAMDIHLKKRISISLGVDYTRINEEMRYSYSGYSNQIVRDTIVKYFKDNTRSTSIVDRKLRFDSSLHTFNTHEMIGISVLGGYLWSKEGWNFSFQAGAKYDFWQNSRGYQTTETGSVVRFNTRSDRTPLYKTYGNLWILTKMSLGYRWANHHEYLLSYSEQLLLNSISQTKYNKINQKYNLHTFRMGYRYYF